LVLNVFDQVGVYPRISAPSQVTLQSRLCLPSVKIDSLVEAVGTKLR
jgi:hypothetical protein